MVVAPLRDGCRFLGLPVFSFRVGTHSCRAGANRGAYTVQKQFGPLVALLCIVAVSLEAKDVHVNGYTRKDGTNVAPHVRTSPNGTKSDNPSTKGNVNPYARETRAKPREQVLLNSSSAPSAKVAAISPIQWTETKMVDRSALKSGLPQSELLRQIGSAKKVGKKQGFEIWTYATGPVVREGEFVAWKERAVH